MEKKCCHKFCRKILTPPRMPMRKNKYTEQWKNYEQQVQCWTKRKYKNVMLTVKDVDDTNMDIETTPRKFMCLWCVKILSPHSKKTFAILYKIRSIQLFP